ncbi:MAG: endonuclease/exonuclease/phosphatase family protein [Tepidisphaeraceae bacterium]
MTLAPPAADATRAQTRPSDAADVRVTSFNIRYLNDKDGPNSWVHRRDVFFDTLTHGQPDLIGLQEVVHAQAEEIRAKLKDYEFVGVGRNDGKEAGEYVPILFKRDRFQKLDEGHIWLSPTPDVVGSKGWDAQLPRIATWVKLHDRMSGGAFMFINTHWDHIGRAARLESAKLLRQRFLNRSPAPAAIITGDFNCTEDDEPYAALVRPPGETPPKLTDTYRAAHPQRSRDESTFSAFTGKRTGSRIDWILHTPEWETVGAEIDYANKDGRYPSDHYPVRAVLKWKADRSRALE